MLCVFACFKVKGSPAVLSRPGFSSPPQGLDLPIVTPKKPIHRVFHTNSKLSLWPHTKDSSFLFCIDPN